MNRPGPTGNTDWPVIDGVVRVQQILLKAGYKYVAGDPDSWPASFVLLHREDRTLAVAPISAQNIQPAVALWRRIHGDGTHGAGE